MVYLMGDVGTSITDVAVHLPHDTNVFVTVKQGVFVILDATSSTGRSLVSL